MLDSMLYIVTTKYPKADPFTGQPLPAKFRGKTKYSVRSVEYEDGGEKVHFESDSKSDAMRYLEKNQADWARKTAATRTLTASDRRRLIRLASSMTAGSPERRAVLAGLLKSASDKLTPDSLLKYMRESGDSVTVRDLNYAFPDAGGSSAIAAMLKRMVKDGKLVKTKREYALAKTAATRPVVEIAPGLEHDDIIEMLDLDGDAGVDFEVTLVLEGRELAKVLGVQERVLVRRLDQREKKRDHLISERDLDAIFDMKRRSIHMGALKAMADLLDYGTDFDIDLDGPQDNPYLSVKRIKPDAVQVTFEVGSIVTA